MSVIKVDFSKKSKVTPLRRTTAEVVECSADELEKRKRAKLREKATRNLLKAAKNLGW